MRNKRSKKVLALVMAAIMVVGLLPITMLGGLLKAKTVVAADDVQTYVLNADDLETATLSADTNAGTENFFTLKSGMQVTTDARTIDDKTFAKRMRKIGATSQIEFTVPEGSTATIVMYARNANGDNGSSRTPILYNTSKDNVVKSFDGLEKGNKEKESAKLAYDGTLEGGKTYIIAADKDIDYYYVKVTVTTEGGGGATIKAPTVSTVTATIDGDKVTVSGTGVAGDEGSKYVIKRNGTQVGTVDGNTDTFSYVDTLKESGTYTYSVVGKGKEESGTPVSAENTIDYVLSLGTPEITLTSTKDDGAETFTVEASWKAVSEADKYIVTVTNYATEEVIVNGEEVTALKYTISNLANDTRIDVTVKAVRTTPEASSEATESIRVYSDVDASDSIPGMKVDNKSNAAKATVKANAIVIRDGGDITVVHSSASASKVQSSGAADASFIYYEDGAEGDFTISADINMTSCERTSPTNQHGVYVGAFKSLAVYNKDTNPDGNKVAAAELSYDGNAYLAYYGALGKEQIDRPADYKKAASVGSFYNLTVSRAGSTYTMVVKNAKGEVVTENTTDITEAALAAGSKVYPAICLAGVCVDIKNLTVIVDGETKVDSTTYTGDFNPYLDNWETADVPVITDATTSSDGTKIKAEVNCLIGAAGASSVKVFMYDENDKLIKSGETTNPGQVNTVELTPPASGTYYLVAMASRIGENTRKFSEEKKSVDFILPIAVPTISSMTNMGSGKVQIRWDAVKEAESYEVSYGNNDKGTDFSSPVPLTDTVYVFEGIPEGTYYFKVKAIRGNDSNEVISTAKLVENKVDREWLFSTFGGSNATKSADKNNTAIGDPNNLIDGKFTVTSGNPATNSLGGKVVGGTSADEMSFLYTPLKTGTNFKLTAKVHISNMKEDGGQVGFGLVATDTVGESGTGKAYYTNSVATFAGKQDYYYDPITDEVSSTSGPVKYTMKNGIGARYKVGSASESEFGNGSVVYPLATDAIKSASIYKMEGEERIDVDIEEARNADEEERALYKYDGGGTFNILKDSSVASTTIDGTSYDTFYLSLVKDNTGFLCVYYDENKTEISRYRIYDLDNEYLTQIDPDNYYVGFFAARCAIVEFSDVDFSTIAASEDAPAEGVEFTTVAPSVSVTTTNSTGVQDYDLKVTANANGYITITDSKGYVLVDDEFISANSVLTAETYTLAKGKNTFNIVFTPEDGYMPGKYQVLSSYEPIELAYNVTYKTIGSVGQSIWIAPEATGSGSKEDPTDIYTAVKYVQPGQQIIIKEGTYYLESKVQVARGVDGTEDEMIYLIADPDADSRPVFDFQRMSAGFVFAGNYWYIQGFDVTNSADKNKAIQVSGNYNTLDQVNAYNNGDTGIQISRLLSSDIGQSMWPSYNTILNCTSYNNADASYADADGFAAKITVGPGNKFIGCISHHNADDGWDLFAYPDTGAIGQVSVYNCVAYSNGYLLDGTDAGNGNGFKLGGNSITGYHKIDNCISYDNKAKGIDCNSCPDIQVSNCTSFNNGSFNVALYSGSAKNTDFSSKGVISFRTKSLGVIDTDGDYVDTTGEKGIKMVGNQDVSKVINESSYYWMESYVADLAMKLPTMDTVALSALAAKTYGSYNAVGKGIDLSCFVSTDTSIEITRNADGSINMNGLLELTEDAPADAGARFVSTPSEVFEAYESVPTGDSNNMVLYIILMVLASAAVAGIVVYEKKRA